MKTGVPPGSFLQAFAPVLQRLEGDAQRYFGTADVRLVPVGYEERPFSFLLRVEVWPPHGKEPATRAFLKIFKPKSPSAGVDLRARVVKDFETTRAISSFMKQWNDTGAIHPIACYEDVLAIVTEEASGTTLLERLRTQARWFPGRVRMQALDEVMAACGRWLERFHDFERSEGNVSVADLRSYIDVRLRRLVDQRVMTGEYREQILRHLDRLAGGISTSDLREVAIHADLAPGNILVSADRIVVLDFAMAGRGSYLHDISRLFLQIDLLLAKPQFMTGTIRRLQAALLRGLDPSLTPAHPLFRYLLMLHRINHLGTLALHRERFPSSILSARARQLHRQWIGEQLKSSGQTA